MANPVLKGSSAPQLQYWEIDFSPTQGGRLSKEYKGIDLTQMSALCNQASVAGYSGKLRYEKSLATLTLETSKLSSNLPGGVTSPASDITDKWEISVDQEKPELFENKNFLGQITTMDASLGVAASQQLIQAIRQVATAGTQANAWKNLLDTLRATPVVDASGVR